MLILNAFITWFYKLGCDRTGEALNSYAEITGNSALTACCKEHGTWRIPVQVESSTLLRCLSPEKPSTSNCFLFFTLL